MNSNLVGSTMEGSVESFLKADFFKSTNQKQEFPVVAIFVNRSGRNVQSL
jgi:hypothetical protein